MADTLIKSAMEISNENSIFKLWDKAQVIIGCSRKIIGVNAIVLGENLLQ